MKSFKQHIFEKLKVSAAPSKITDVQFYDAVFNYCKNNDTPEIIALNIYGELDNIPEICYGPNEPKRRVNFALRPEGKNKIVNLEIWEYNLKNEPIEMLTYIRANDYAFDVLKNKIFDEETILDIYNYCA